MAYRLGIDMGTASCAIARVELNDRGEPVDIDGSVLIFEEPLEPSPSAGVGAPKKATRREKRSARRLLERRKRDTRWIKKHYGAFGIGEAELADARVFSANGVRNIHELRAKAARKPVTLPGLIRVLGKMRKRRGYKGRFRETSDSGPVQTGIQVLRDAMKKAGCETLGEYLLWRYQRGETLKLKEAGLYVHRTMVEKEFACIWAIQSAHHPALTGEYEGKPWRDIFHDYVFYQRPLRSPAPLVGRCELEPTLPRAPKAQPVFQKFRILKTLNDLAWSDGSPLSEAQRECIAGLLRDPRKLRTDGTITFDKIYEELHRRGLMHEAGVAFNLDTGGRRHLKGDLTRKTMARMGLLEVWDALDEPVQRQVINLLADMGSPEVFDDPDWAESLRTPSGKTRNLHPDTIRFINDMAGHPKFGRLAAMGFDVGRAEYSIKAMQKLLPLLCEGMQESEAKDAAYPDWRRKKGEQPELSELLPTHPATGNVSVDCALRNLRREINRIITEHGPPAEIIIEMSRNMRLGYRKRNEISRRIAANERARRQARKTLEEVGYPATGRNVLRYLLWMEQEQRWCPFCDRAINLADALDGNATNIEHIIPFSLTRVGRQRSKLVLAHTRCNMEKGNRTPWQAWGGDKERWSIIEARAESFEERKLYGKARQLLLRDFEEDVLTDETIAGFAQRQYHETGWMTRLAREWLTQVCSRVFVSRGALTANLRRQWGLESVIPEVRLEEGLPVLDEQGNALDPADLRDPETRTDKRIDHRHHLVDAVAIAYSTPSLFQRMARDYKQASENTPQGGKVKLRLRVDAPLPDLRERVKALVEACPVRHKPDRYPDGQLFEDTAYRLVEVEGKNGEREWRLASRKRLKDVADGNATQAKLRAFVKGIVYPETRRVVEEAVETRLAEGVKPVNVFDEPILHPLTGKPIKRVFWASDKQGDFETIIMSKGVDEQALKCSPNAFRKHLKHAGFAWLEVNSETGERKLVPVVEGMRRKHEPTPPNIIRFFKGDTIIHSKDGKRYVVRQIKSEGGGMLVCTLVSEARPVRDLSSTSGLKKIKGRTLLKTKLADE